MSDLGYFFLLFNAWDEFAPQTQAMPLCLLLLFDHIWYLSRNCCSCPRVVKKLHLWFLVREGKKKKLFPYVSYLNLTYLKINVSFWVYPFSLFLILVFRGVDFLQKRKSFCIFPFCCLPRRKGWEGLWCVLSSQVRRGWASVTFSNLIPATPPWGSQHCSLMWKFPFNIFFFKFVLINHF